VTRKRAPSAVNRIATAATRREVLLGLSVIFLTHWTWAQTETVPLSLQAKLLAKVVKYDRNFKARADGHVTVSILADASVAESRRSAVALRNELSNLNDIGGLPFRVIDQPYCDEAALHHAITAEHVTVLFVTSGLSQRVPVVARAASGLDVLTVSTVADDVQAGIVLGFDLVSGQPKLLLNLASAQKQNISFEPQALKLMKVYR
jgi:hypothetical protein